MFIIKTDSNRNAKVVIDGEVHENTGSATRAIHAAYQEMRVDLRDGNLEITFGCQADDDLKVSVLQIVEHCAVTVSCDQATQAQMKTASERYWAGCDNRVYTI